MELFFHAFSKLNCNDRIKREYEDVMVEKISASQTKKLVFIYCSYISRYSAVWDFVPDSRYPIQIWGTCLSLGCSPRSRMT